MEKDICEVIRGWKDNRRLNILNLLGTYEQDELNEEITKIIREDCHNPQATSIYTFLYNERRFINLNSIERIEARTIEDRSHYIYTIKLTTGEKLDIEMTGGICFALGPNYIQRSFKHIIEPIAKAGNKEVTYLYEKEENNKDWYVAIFSDKALCEVNIRYIIEDIPYVKEEE